MPFEHFSFWERLLLSVGLVRRARYTDRVARCAGAEMSLHAANALADRRMATLAALRDELAESFAAEPHERELILALRERREAITRDWTDAEREAVRALLLSPAGGLITAEMRAAAHQRLRDAVRAAPGSEPRALGFAHGWVCAGEALAALTLSTDEPAESGS